MTALRFTYSYAGRASRWIESALKPPFGIETVTLGMFVIGCDLWTIALVWLAHQ